ncbi:MAG: PLP-dependent aminotransferase family protein [Cellulosilyticaceae bacterium]
MDSRKKEPLYIQLYEYYKERIEEGTLKEGDSLPSIRRMALERHISRTTVEAAYFQLVAEGYVNAEPGSGYYVNALDYSVLTLGTKIIQEEKIETYNIRYDFATGAVDPNSFNFDIWRRYIKSALRNTERLISYGDVQGEYDLRVAISHYVREKRGVICMPEQIVIGAGMQALLHMLCAIHSNPSSIIFTGINFKQGKAIFDDRGYKTYACGKLDENFEMLKAKQIGLLYTSPSHIQPWGEVMSMKTRLALLKYAREANCLIIEDDYDSEFNYYSRPTPSLQGLDGGTNVVYMSTFSKLLIPSLRICFMVLPSNLMPAYYRKREDYNQTASTVEQIALCQFIRDGHLERQIKKAKKLYVMKKKKLEKTIKKVFQNQIEVQTGSGGFIIKITIQTKYKQEEFIQKAKECGILLKKCEESKKDAVTLLLSCSSVSEEHYEEVFKQLKESWSELIK